MFMAGAAFAVSTLIWVRLERCRWAAFLIAITFWACLAWARPSGVLADAVVAIFQWSAVAACFGFAKRHLSFDHPLRPLLTEAVFPVYILHQTLLIIASQFLLPLRIPPGIEAPLLLSLTFSLSFCGYLMLRRIAVLRPWFGMRTSVAATRSLPKVSV